MMRRIMLSMALAMMLGTVLTGLPYLLEAGASASKANSPLLTQGRGSVSINDASLTEGDAGTSNMVFVVTVTGSPSNTVGVDYSTANGGATSPSDYISTSGQLRFDPGGTATMSITVPIVGDTSPESVETFFVNLSIVDSSGDLADGQGVGTIHDTDAAPALPALSISDVSVNEGHSGSVDAVFTVSLSAASGSEVTVNFASADGTATVADNDYASRSGTVTFPAGDSSPRSITVPIVGDTRNEPDETFLINLSNATNATISDEQGICTILNEDAGTCALTINPASQTFSPGRGSGNIAVTASAGCSWQASTNDSWISITSGASGTGSGTVTYSVSSNDSGFFGERAGKVFIGDKTFTILQQGLICHISLSPLTHTVPYTGGTSSFLVLANSDCEWQVELDTMPGNDFVTLLSGATGTGSETVQFSVSTHRGPRRRTSRITIKNRNSFTQQESFVITQESGAASCTFEISPRSKLIDPDGSGSAGSFTVTTQNGCEWRAVSSANWLDLSISCSPCAGSGSVSYSAGSNSGSFRSASISAGGQLHTVHQQPANCPIELIEHLLCTWFPSVFQCGDPGLLSVSREFRDEVLEKTPRRQRYTKLYYQASKEVVQILILNPMFVLRSREVTERYLPVIEAMVKGEQVTLTEGDIAELDSFLKAVAAKGSPELQETIEDLSNDLRDPQVHTEFNITVTEGEKRALPAKSSVQSMKQSGMVIAPFGALMLLVYAVKFRHKTMKTAQRRVSKTGPAHGNVRSTNREFFAPATVRASGHIYSLLGDLRAGRLILPIHILRLLGWLFRHGRRVSCVVLSVLVVSGQSSLVWGQPKDNAPKKRGQDPVVGRGLRNNSGTFPITFEANQGQADTQVKFLSRGPGGTLFLTPTEAILAMATPKAGDAEKLRQARKPTIAASPLRRVSVSNSGSPVRPLSVPPAVLRMRLIGANHEARMTGLDELPIRTNYFLGSDPAKWRTSVSTFSKVKYESVYDGVDMLYYGNQQELEYDFIISPGAEPSAIALGFEGAEKIELDRHGDLVMGMAGGEVRMRRPLVYQEVNGLRSIIPARYALQGIEGRESHPMLTTRHSALGTDKPSSLVTFQVGPYDHSKPLTIDPVLAYSTYFGGGGNEEGNSIAVDSAGNVYITGFTDSMNFPLISASQPTSGGGQQDAFVVKLDPSGTRVVYSTYLGGSAQDNATAVSADAAGNAYITGFTDSPNFPVKDALQPVKEGAFNAFILKLDPSGSILSSTLLGGSVGDYGSSIALDNAGNVYAAGISASPDFPTTANTMQGSHSGLADAYVTKLDPSATRILYSTYLGASGIDGASSIAVDSAGSVYLTGLTSSPDFRTVSPLQPRHGGGAFDAFVTKLNPSGSEVVYSTYLGGGGQDRAFRIAVDSSGSAYLTGDTDSADFPLANAVQQSNGGSADAFVAKLNPSGNQLIYSTYLGGSGIDGGTAICVDSAGSAYVTGFTASMNFPTINPIQRTSGGAYDGFVAKLSTSGSSLDYSTYLGGDGIDTAFGVAVDTALSVYVMGVTVSTNFPTVSPLQGINGGGPADIFIAKIRSGPLVTGAMVNGKKLLVFGTGFDQGARISLNGQQQKTINDDRNPTASLVGKTAGKKIAPGEKVNLQVRNSDGTLSNEFSFTRPAQ